MTGDPVEGVTFTIKVADGRTITTEATNAQGEIILENLDPGVVEIWEQSVLDNYIIDTEHQLITLISGKLATVQFQNYPKPTLKIAKVDIDGNPLTGAICEVKTKAGVKIGDYLVGADGTITVPNTKLDEGCYIITEKQAPSGYILDGTPHEVYLEAGRTTEISIEDEKKPSLTLRKIDSIVGDGVQGAKFEIWVAKNQSQNGAYQRLDSTYYYTDENGLIELDNLDPGWYKIVEVEPPEGYLLKDPFEQIVYLEHDKTPTVTFENIPKSTLIIRKVNADTGAPLADTWFRVRYLGGTSGTGGTVIGEYPTSSSGSIIITGLDAGTYICEEINASHGYVMDTAPQTAYISGKEQDCITLTFTNSKYGALLIKKVDSVTGEPLSNVQFFVTDSDGSVIGNSNGYFTTDSAGTILISEIEPGTTLVVKETRTLPDYLLDDVPQTIKITSNETKTLEFRNQPKGTLLVVKKDSVTGDPLAGVQFKITYADGSFVDAAGGKLSTLGLYTTDQNGQITISGITGAVVVTEVQTIEGYTIDEDTRTQTVVVNPNDTQTLMFYNTPTSSVQLIKTDADTDKRLAGVAFEIRRMDGGLVDAYTTDKNGRFSVSLDSGNYYAVEIKAPAGYQRDDTPHYFEVKDGKTTTLTVTNKAFSGIILHKVDSVTGEGISGVKFLVYDQNKDPIGEYETDGRGYIYLDTLTVAGKGRLYLRELEAAPGYELDKEYKTVYVQPGKTIEIEWENTPITAQIQVCKYAAEYNEITGTPAGTPLQGAVYEISEARSGKVVEYITTDARGVAASSPLPLGRYKVVEVTAPIYWQLSGTAFDETLAYSGQIIKLSDYDKPANLDVSITKRGNAEVLAGNQMRYDITVANQSNVALEDFFWHDRIPTDAARAAVLTTGTYSARLNYRILYKTNYTAEYQVLASNLLTSSNYSFALSAIPMQAGEVITDIYFDFGKVPVGFQSVTGPTLTVQILGTAVNGYQLINRADVGGRYQNIWQTAQARWLTMIRRLTPALTLPQTGF